MQKKLRYAKRPSSRYHIYHGNHPVFLISLYSYAPTATGADKFTLSKMI